jgi:hypothetical protein
MYRLDSYALPNFFLFQKKNFPSHHALSLKKFPTLVNLAFYSEIQYPESRIQYPVSRIQILDY